MFHLESSVYLPHNLQLVCGLGTDHTLGLDPFIELFGCQVSTCYSRLLQRRPALMSGLSNLTCLVISNVRIQSGDQHQASMQKLMASVFVGLDTDNAVLREA